MKPLDFYNALSEKSTEVLQKLTSEYGQDVAQELMGSIFPVKRSALANLNKSDLEIFFVYLDFSKVQLYGFMFRNTPLLREKETVIGEYDGSELIINHRNGEIQVVSYEPVMPVWKIAKSFDHFLDVLLELFLFENLSENYSDPNSIIEVCKIKAGGEDYAYFYDSLKR